jgi:hypothetical protein
MFWHMSLGDFEHIEEHMLPQKEISASPKEGTQPG